MKPVFVDATVHGWLTEERREYVNSSLTIENVTNAVTIRDDHDDVEQSIREGRVHHCSW